MVSQTERNQLLPGEWREGLDHLRLNEPIPEDLFLRLTAPAQPRTNAQALAICEELAVLFGERPLTWAIAEVLFEVPEGDRIGHKLEEMGQEIIDAWKSSDALLKGIQALVQSGVPGALDYPYPIPPESPRPELETAVSPPMRSIDADTEIVLRQAAKLAVAVVPTLPPSLTVARLYQYFPFTMDKRAPHGKELRELATQLKEEERRFKLEARLRQDPLDLAALFDAVDVYAHQEERLRDVREKILRAIRTQPPPEVVQAFHRSSIGDYILGDRPRITLTDPATQEEVDVAAEVFEELHARGAYDQALAKSAGRYFCSILDEAESCPFEYLWGYAELVIGMDSRDLPLAVESWLRAAERAVVEESPLRAQGAFIWAIAGRTLHLWLDARPDVKFVAPEPLRIRWTQLVQSAAELGNFDEIRAFLVCMREFVTQEGQPGGFCQQFDLDLKEAVLRIEAEARQRRVPLSFGEAEPHHRESMMQLIGPDLWFRLHVKTQTFLAQADFFYQFGVMADIPHWASVAILYFNALENEVAEKVPRQWRTFFLADRRPPLPQFFDFLEAARKGVLGGSHWKMLAQNVSDPETLISILPEVRSLYTRLRNPAAHAGECSRQNIEELRQLFSAGGLFTRFLEALQPLPRVRKVLDTIRDVTA